MAFLNWVERNPMLAFIFLFSCVALVRSLFGF